MRSGISKSLGNPFSNTLLILFYLRTKHLAKWRWSATWQIDNILQNPRTGKKLCAFVDKVVAIVREQILILTSG